MQVYHIVRLLSIVMRGQKQTDEEVSIPAARSARWKRRDRQANPKMKVSGRGTRTLAARLQNQKKRG